MALTPKRPVAAIGVGQTRFGPTRDAATYVELLHQAASAALESSSLGIDDIDAIVLALAPESLMGVNHAERWCTDVIGGRMKPVLRIQTGGATGLSAVQAGYHHIASGMFERVLVVGADRVRESGDAQKIFNKIWDPFYERDLPFTTITMIAMSAVRYMHRHGMTERQMARVAQKAHHNGALNPNAHIRREVTVEEVLESRYLAWPIKLLDACPQSAGGCAVVLSSDDAVDQRLHSPVWISGISMAGETYFIGDRLEISPRGYDYGDAEALAVAAERAYAMAGITDPQREIDAVETYASFSPVEIHNAEALGLAPLGGAGPMFEEGRFDLDGEIPINPSGGVICTNPISVTAMVRFAEAVMQVQGRAGEHQVAGAKTVVATGAGGSHQFFNVAVLSAEQRT
ncbi:MAG: acetyl-CoA C-acetyltransferase [Solirubrobacteraceae bacterium]|jgi:acetyl-CoA C-acetyltransferase|nr:acetyl-CoA C-acetyltransferase [Solirubrobacteraceae bacterium]